MQKSYTIQYQRIKKNVFLSEFGETEKETHIKLEVFDQSYELCGKQERLHKTTPEVLLCNTKGGSQCQLENYEQKNYHQTHICFRLTTMG